MSVDDIGAVGSVEQPQGTSTGAIVWPPDGSVTRDPGHSGRADDVAIVVDDA